MGIRCADQVTPLYPQKLALTLPTGGGRSVGIVRSRTKATEFSFSILMYSGIKLQINLCEFRLPVANVDEKCALLANYAANSGNFLPTFRYKLSFPSQGSRIQKKKVLTTEDGNEKLSQNFGNYHYSLGNNPEERSSYLNKQLEPATYVITANGNRLFLYVYSIITD